MEEICLICRRQIRASDGRGHGAFGNLLCKNVMKPGNVYLIFCEKAEYQDDDEITDTWAQFSDRKLLTDSNELISEFNELKQAMFDEWGIDRTKYME